MRVRPILIKITVAVFGLIVVMLLVRVVRRPATPTPDTGGSGLHGDATSGLKRAALSIAGWGDPLPICQSFYHSICHKRGETRDPTGTVRPDLDGEVVALRLFQELVNQHPDWSSDQVDEELVKQIYTPTRRTRVETAYRWVDHAMERFVNRQPDSVFSPAEKHRLKERLHNTKLELPPPAKTYDDEPDLFTKSDVYYERTADGHMRMRVGGAFLITVKSWFNMVFTVGHELAHAIDPCEVKSVGMHMAAYDRLTSCFQRDGIITARPPSDECGPHDQLSEAFADWVAVQVTAEALHQFAIEFPGPQLANAATNAVRDLCEQDDSEEDLDIEMHPKPEIRIERIFGQNPRIREILGCSPLPPNTPYCGFESDSITNNVEKTSHDTNGPKHL